MILKTYARIFTVDIEVSLDLLRKLVGREPDLRFAFRDLEIAAIGDFCVVAGPAASLAQYRSSQGPIVVDNLEETQSLLLAAGAKITVPPSESDSGVFLYARHPDGVDVEYVQWKPELVKRILSQA
ncbi:MAG: VOC family protein [Terracidiphilus sp.]|nr:VOC family protein [Terracidiphilus sp.]MDR3775506.1 VOC family protein [Terracidiphilus sp.]